MVAGVRVQRRLVIAATMLVAGLVLAGCTGDLDPPVPLPTPTVTATPTVTPTVPPTATPSPTVTPSPSTPAAAKVSVVDNTFNPEVTEITAGQTVTWAWEGDAKHDVVGDGFDSGQLEKGATFSHQFTTAGTYAYVCTLHGGMTGRIDVKAAT
jgi:plastocyanin